ncbi:hypothetical protein BCR32DRAFT_283016 [Anaeromyces robustus]|uniref:Chitin-binding type-1 domain-containing protein n=1 Tax=Anaeromyces robustus TaxID=1754192 RepID=A0A1Y1WWR3_9FUNG|nr:hypothetical protein BCR32DRAFT_283016 [Anaeromyces robustus]|eukprot:ORX77646.1 hypothetical protein BCR32DRAFT_283016 [Anaeromyces robustus]
MKGAPTVNPNATPKWIYNPSAKICLWALSAIDKKPRIWECGEDEDFKWYLSPYPKGYIYSAYYEGRCFTLMDPVNGKIKVSDCTKASSYEFNYDEGLLYLDNDHSKCMGIGDGDPTNDNGAYLRPCKKDADQKWEIWDRNPSSVINADYKIIWIYNKYLNKCLLSGSRKTYRPVMGDCTNNNLSKWLIPISGDGFIKSLYMSDLCINVSDAQRGTLIMKDCNNEAVFLDINKNERIISPLNNKCIGYLESDNTKLNLNTCDSNKEDQYWMISNSYPYANNNVRCSSKVKCPVNQCCSEDGYCGISNKHCGNGCQNGKCIDRCGPNFANQSCGEECCSEYNWCGTSNEHCKISNRCQPAYGRCFN